MPALWKPADQAWLSVRHAALFACSSHGFQQNARANASLAFFNRREWQRLGSIVVILMPRPSAGTVISKDIDWTWSQVKETSIASVCFFFLITSCTLKKTRVNFYGRHLNAHSADVKTREDDMVMLSKTKGHCMRDDDLVKPANYGV